MGVMPENKLLLNMALPMIISMLIQACYNIVDSYFVAKLSEDALNAVSLAFPGQDLIPETFSAMGYHGFQFDVRGVAFPGKVRFNVYRDHYSPDHYSCPFRQLDQETLAGEALANARPIAGGV